LNNNININKLDYNQEKQEFELSSASNAKIKLLQKINHFGDVNKVRYMPQKPNILASANNHGDLVIYERTKLASVSRYNDTELPKPQIHLRAKSPANNSDIFALDWNLHSEAILASGDTTGHINIYDLNKYSSKSNELDAVKHIVNDLAINDLEWFPHHDSLLSVVDEGGHYRIYDTRSDKFVTDRKLSNCGINNVSSNPGLSTCFATGDSTGVVSVWDVRNLDKSSYEIKDQHTDSITQLKWHRKFHNVLGSSSTDALVRLFDMSKHTETNDGLMFVHQGHMLGVNDFDWSYHDDWLVASVADDNSLHIWKPAHTVTGGYK
jgi:histone-binding protein RBBP4